jgi:SHS2 domain-containing protein
MGWFEHLDHTADVALRGIGATVGEAFSEAARGLFALMVDLDAVRETKQVRVSVQATSLDLLLVAWLSRLLAEKDLLGLALCRFAVRIERGAAGMQLVGRGWGEPLDTVRHGAGLEVKGVSYAGLQVWEEDGRWTAQCVVDT